MKTRLFSLFTASAILLASGTTLYAANDSIQSAAEQRIEKSAKDIAAESMEIAATAIKTANKNAKKISKEFENHLDDTLFLTEIPADEMQEENELITYHYSRFQDEKDLIEGIFDKINNTGKRISFFILLIIALIIINSIVKRRQKYRIIEKAIENNYPLPDELLGKSSKPTTIQHVHYTQPIGNNSPAGQVRNVTEFNVSDWASFRSGIKWCAWGISFMLFFIIVDAPVWVFALIPLIIGLGKLYAAYKIQKTIDNAKTYTQKESQAEESQPTPPPFQNENNTNENGI